MFETIADDRLAGLLVQTPGSSDGCAGRFVRFTSHETLPNDVEGIISLTVNAFFHHDALRSFYLFEGLDAADVLDILENKEPETEHTPQGVEQGIHQFLCSAPHHGEFWGYDVRRFAWFKAAQEAVVFMEKHLLKARCFENRFDLLAYALSKVSVPDGLFLEFGVFKGETLRFIAERTKQTVYGFDSFRGLPEDWEQLMPKGAFYTFGKVPETDQGNIRFVKGWFAETLPAFTEKHKKACAFIHIDCDLYSSTRDVLDSLKRFIVPGTVLVFDELYNFPGWQRHEYKALMEFVQDSAMGCDYLGYVGPGCQVAVRMMDETR
ncbi:TylF/MycF/NovP-related O-methyltransferase [Desulfatiferula olefinivorans]